MEGLKLRKAKAEDEGFLLDLFLEIRGSELGKAGLPEQALRHLLVMQYDAQNLSYRGRFREADSRIIELNGQRIGRQLTAIEAGATRLIDISISSGFRGRGVGSFFLERLKNGSERVSLSVYRLNEGALRLYLRHGFSITGEDGMYLNMEWKNV